MGAQRAFNDHFRRFPARAVMESDPSHTMTVCPGVAVQQRDVLRQYAAATKAESFRRYRIDLLWQVG